MNIIRRGRSRGGGGVFRFGVLHNGDEDVLPSFLYALLPPGAAAADLREAATGRGTDCTFSFPLAFALALALVGTDTGRGRGTAAGSSESTASIWAACRVAAAAVAREDGEAGVVLVEEKGGAGVVWG